MDIAFEEGHDDFASEEFGRGERPGFFCMIEGGNSGFTSGFAEGGGNTRASPISEPGPSLFEKGSEGGGRVGGRGGP